MSKTCQNVILNLLAATVFAGGSFCAEDGTQAKDREENRVTVNVTRVALLVTVTDKKERFVSDLEKDDFEISENNRVQKILQFRSEADVPLRLAVLIDTSNSVRERFRFLQEAAIAFLRSTLRPEIDKAVVISFDTVVEVAADFSGNVDELASRIRELRPGRGTTLYDAVDFACRKKLVEAGPGHDFRRAILILSDGDDTQSSYTRAHALEMAHKSDTVIYTISTSLDQPNAMGSKVLKNLSEDTGGRALFPFGEKDLPKAFKDLTAELRNQYSIIYRPDPLVADGRFHLINVQVKNHKDVKNIRVRRGYYALPR